MKKALLVIAVLALLVGGALFYLAMNANSLIAKYKPDLERIASSSLGSHVTLGKLEASVFPSAQVKVDEFRIARDATAKDALSLKNLLLHIRLLPLLSGKLEIVKLSLDSPSLTFIKDKNGISIEGLPKPAAPTAAVPATSPTASSPASATQGSPVPAGLGLALQKFEIKNASLTLKDVEAHKEFHVSNINVDAGVQFEQNVARIQPLLVSAKVLESLDVRVDGETITYNLAQGNFDVSKIDVATLGGHLFIKAAGSVPSMSGTAQIDSTNFDLTKMDVAYSFVPALKTFGLKGAAKPKIDAEWGPGGTYKAQGAISLSNIAATLPGGFNVTELHGNLGLNANNAAQGISSTDLTLKLGSEPVTVGFEAGLSGSQAELKKLSVGSFGGTVAATGKLDLTTQKFSGVYDLATIAIDRAVAVLMPALSSIVSGTVQSVKGNIAGALGPDLKQSLTGTAAVLVKDGSLKGLNLASEVLRAVKDLPFLQGSLLASAPADQRAALDSPNTAIQELSGNFSLGNASLATQDFKMLSTIFLLNATGSVGFNMDLDLNAQIGFDPTLSAALVARTPQLKAIQQDNGRLLIPLMLKGIPPKILVLPDLEKLAKVAAQAALKEGANKLLDNVLKGGGGGGKKGLGGLFGF